ncbi:MAG: tRNA-dihydrouridine synthase, partial [Nitrospinae bacterium]|nr:tRNA-dihydrouridine synthase [Nitrospinota bacterium]
TIAQKDPGFVADACKKFPGKIMVGIDARDGNVAVKGWVEISNQKATDLARQLETCGVAGYIFTDIGRDGMLQGPNLKSIRDFADNTQLPVIASGGVSQLKDIEDLLTLAPNGVEGIIIGKALYDESFTYPDTLKLLDRHAG